MEGTYLMLDPSIGMNEPDGDDIWWLHTYRQKQDKAFPKHTNPLQTHSYKRPARININHYQ